MCLPGHGRNNSKHFLCNVKQRDKAKEKREKKKTRRPQKKRDRPIAKMGHPCVVGLKKDKLKRNKLIRAR